MDKEWVFRGNVSKASVYNKPHLMRGEKHCWHVMKNLPKIDDLPVPMNKYFYEQCCYCGAIQIIYQELIINDKEEEHGKYLPISPMKFYEDRAAFIKGPAHCIEREWLDYDPWPIRKERTDEQENSERK